MAESQVLAGSYAPMFLTLSVVVGGLAIAALLVPLPSVPAEGRAAIDGAEQPAAGSLS